VRGKNVRSYGLKQVDTIPRLEPDEDANGESRGLARLLGAYGEEGFTPATFTEDLERTLAFVQGLPSEPGSGKPGDLYAECVRILHEEIDRARHIALLRKAVPRA
jgi:hypothetical protein